MNMTDVVIVGAGPVGLLSAIELTLGGVHVLVLERLASASTVTKALGIGPLGSEALHRRGMAAAMDASEARTVAARTAFMELTVPDGGGRGPKLGGHFGGLKLIRTDVQNEPKRRARLVDQHAIEAMLTDRALGLGIAIRRECDVTRFVQQDESLEVEWASPTGEDGIRCAWLVGCDGGRSAVRKMAGFNFPGTDPTMTMYSAVVEIDHPDRLMPADWHRTSNGMFSYGAFPDRLFMLDFSGPPKDRQAPVTREEIEVVLRHISGADVRVRSLESGSRWTDNTRLVETYRRGRVLLAGDAAHIHSPFGGQGMSLGLGDAANLGWKLAMVIRGTMPERLVDTYNAERRPVAEAVLANTRAQAAIMRPDPQSGAMRDIVASLMQFDDVNRFFGDMMSGLGTRYHLGSEHPLIGRLSADIAVGENGASLYALMRDGGGILVDATGGVASRIAAEAGIHCVAARDRTSLLLRPDACIAWAGEGSEIDGLATALARWFGLAANERDTVARHAMVR